MVKLPAGIQGLALLVMIGGVLFAQYAVPTPWALHIGGRSTLDEHGSRDGFVAACGQLKGP
jgi:hypothetical protein